MSDPFAGLVQTGPDAPPPEPMSSADPLPGSWWSAPWRGLKAVGRFMLDCVDALDFLVFFCRILMGLGRAIFAVFKIFD